jgi:hypothetical protein
MQEIIIGIAEFYSNFESIYFPLKMDPTMISYIKELLTPIVMKVDDKEVTNYLVDPLDTDNYLTGYDINVFVKTFIIVIRQIFTKMHALKHYIKS